MHQARGEPEAFGGSPEEAADAIMGVFAPFLAYFARDPPTFAGVHLHHRARHSHVGDLRRSCGRAGRRTRRGALRDRYDTYGVCSRCACHVLRLPRNHHDCRQFRRDQSITARTDPRNHQLRPERTPHPGPVAPPGRISPRSPVDTAFRRCRHSFHSPHVTRSPR